MYSLDGVIDCDGLCLSFDLLMNAELEQPTHGDDFNVTVSEDFDLFKIRAPLTKTIRI